MLIRIKLYAMLSEYLPAGAKKNEADMTVPEDENVQAVLQQLHMPSEMCHLVLVNGSYIAPSERVGHKLVEGDHLAVWPPVAGG
ncbi:MAG: MoaD/ThiS family protein [Rhodospirillales bacterium]|mgnify:CR=1 FL=1|jgi:sulfur-carrier protein|nr:MoaD/ThiS family protein [Rhodospirillales bacterium]MBT3765648.1 MoaD/ThiS family protein [Rhodospirillales bacterium]MBT4040548.1 MoaD/ThiS family protein [Rhodospirillales bacterium]MBT4626993.1 MoaD/ThiS family protein [Rhodospirillales bacterium]MBT5352248.1 MoaD/ThiS family protein [Rhodospirillales bacterium]